MLAHTPTEHAQLVEHWQQALAAEGRKFAQDSDKALKACKYKRFTSRSKGRGRPRKIAEVVRLLGYAGAYLDLDGNERRVADKLDQIAHEVLSDSVDHQDVNLAEELVRILERGHH